jgi:hypothetical protein
MSKHITSHSFSKIRISFLELRAAVLKYTHINSGVQSHLKFLETKNIYGMTMSGSHPVPETP